MRQRRLLQHQFRLRRRNTMATVNHQGRAVLVALQRGVLPRTATLKGRNNLLCRVRNRLRIQLMEKSTQSMQTIVRLPHPPRPRCLFLPRDILRR